MSVSPSGAPPIPVRAVGRPSGRADLHCHTHYSDGSDSPAAVVAEARRRRLDVLAVTDHDTLDGALPAVDIARRPGVITGLEIVVGEEVTSLDGHILGLFLKRPVAPGPLQHRGVIREQVGEQPGGACLKFKRAREVR